MHVYTIVSTQIKPLESMELTQKEGVNIRLNGVTDPPAEPTAEPEAFGLLAPRRGLTAT